MDIFETHRPGFVISTDPARLQLSVIHTFLAEQSYWAQGRSLETIRCSLEHSLNFGVYAFPAEPGTAPEGEQDPSTQWKPAGQSDYHQVGLARVVTDYATFAWLCDVFVLDMARGQGLGKWLIESVVSHPVLSNIRRLMLATRDAHELYRRYGGFEMLPNPERWMVRINPDAH